MRAPVSHDSSFSPDLSLDSIPLDVSSVTKSKIFIFEDKAFSQIALESILFDELKLRKHITFYNSGTSIAKQISDYFHETSCNQVALIIVDYKMPGLTGVELIKWTREYLRKKGTLPEDMPSFAFRAQQFWELPPDEIREVFDLGIKSEDVIEKVVKKEQIERYFKRIGYYYRHLADAD